MKHLTCSWQNLFSRTFKIASYSILIVSLFGLSSCSESPTGRQQFIAISSGQMKKLGQASFKELKSNGNVSQDKALNQYVGCISNRLLKAYGEKPEKWEVKIFNDESLNAFALPGKKIGIHSGMIKFATADELAAVIGHEIAHVEANHGAERMTMAMTGQIAVTASKTLLENSKYSDYAVPASAALALGAQYGVLLPYSRTHESEADEMGLLIAASAGFSPEAAVTLWQKMGSKSKGAPPEFLSTHPSHKTRIKDLTKLMKKAEKLYQQSDKNTGCKKP